MGLKTKKNIVKAVFIILTVIFALSLSMFLYNYAHAGKIYRNVYIDGINLQGKTKAQTKSIIENIVNKRLENQLVVQSGDKELEVGISETGIEIDTQRMILEAFQQGRGDNFFQSLYASAETVYKKKQLDYPIFFDHDLYENYLSRVSSNLEIPPINASLEIKNGQVITNSSKSGVTIDLTNLEEQVKNGFVCKQGKYSFQIQTIPVTPSLIADDLAIAKNQAESYLNHTVILTLNDQVYSANRATIGNWIAFKSEGGNYYAFLNNAAIKAFTNKVAAKNDISVIDNKVSAIDGAVLQEGRQGIYINQDDAINKIVSGLKSSSQNVSIALTQHTKDPQTLTVFPDEGIVPGRFPGKYIDIDLTKQLLTIFEGISQIGQYVISSGKASMPTPTGTGTVANKDPRAWSNKYGLWMPYWMGIGGDYGIHELPEWPGGYKEGENHLGTPVSHGCVRLGVGAAQTVYNWTEIGIPVYIHK
jgi:hypothetical protein